MTELLRFMEANLIFIIPALLVVMFGLSRLDDRLQTMAMGVVSISLFAAFMLFMAMRVPSPDLFLFLVAAVVMAAYDFLWASRRANKK